MMNVYAAQQHVLILSDTIDAEAHQHAFVQVTVSLADRFKIEVAGRSVECAGIVIDSNIRHELHASDHPLLMLLIDRTSTLAQSFRRDLGEQGYKVLDVQKVHAAASYINREHSTITGSESYTVFLKHLLEQLGVIYLPPTITDARIRTLIHLIQICTDSQHSIPDYAQQIGLSASRLSHLFKAEIGISLNGYILLHKLQKASYLIFKGTSITEAAMHAGFDTPSHFANTSRKLLGMTARDIRKDSVFLQVSRLHES